MKEERGRLGVPVNGEEVSVANVPYMRCPACREVVLRLADARWLDREAIARYRGKRGLLSAEEIRALRERAGLTQGELARLLGLGPNTLSRWEAGRNAQTAAMDILLRLVRDVPGSLNYLRSRAA